MSVSENLIASWAHDLFELEDQIEALQDGKKDLYAAIRDEHGKQTANALKRAVKLARMDSEKRDEADALDTEAFRILGIIEGAARAPRATRAIASSVPVSSEAQVRAERSAWPDRQHEPADPDPSGVAADSEPVGADQPVVPNAREGGEGATPLPADIPEPDHGEAGVIPVAASEPATEDAEQSSDASSVVPFRSKQELEPPHPDCQKPELCKGFSNLKLCETCRNAAAGFVQIPHQGDVA
jgi:hypothetical protein